MPDVARRTGLTLGFDSVSNFERHQADLFFQDLTGRRHSTRGFAPTAVEDAGNGAAEDFHPEDLAPDMAGLEFILPADGDVKTSTGATIRQPAGTVVTVTKWENDKPDIEGKIAGTKVTVLKELIAPNATQQESTVTTAKGQHKVATPLYSTDAKALGAAIVAGKKAGRDQTNNYKALNTHLIIETQLNRFDRDIARWTGFYDVIIGEPKDWKPLPPSWVKSMMVEESTAGSAGKHLSEVAGAPMKTRFNVLQAIDDWGPQQFIMMQELDPGRLKKKGLDKVMDDQRALEKEWQSLDKKTSRTTAQEERFKYLSDLKFRVPATRKSPKWHKFFRSYPDVDLKPKPSSGSKAGAAGPATTTSPDTDTGTTGTTTASGSSPRAKYWDEVVAFLEEETPKRKYSYSFWIRTGIRWLYEKRKGTSTWSDAVRAYNGEGARAEFYRAIVLTRARASAVAAGIEEDIWADLVCWNAKAAKTKDGTFPLCAFERQANNCEPRC